MTLHEPLAPAAPTYAAPHAPAAYPAPAPQPVVPERYNLFSLVSFIGAFLVPIVGIVFGHLALRQVRRTNEAGRGFALAGLWIGYGTIALTIVFVFVYFALLFSMMLSFGSMYANSGYYA